MSDDAIKTVAGEITKIAVEHGYNGVAPKTITGAIDALADTLAGNDVDSGNTVAQAVRALAPYIGSGGGGSLGALQPTPWECSSQLQVGETFENGAISPVKDLLVGGVHVIGSNEENEQYCTLATVAEGAVITPVLFDGAVDAMYYVSFGDEYVIATIETADIEYENDEANNTVTFTMPSVPDGCFLVMHTASV